jgi:hypothetical protein
MAQDVIQPAAIQWVDRPLEALRAQVVPNDNQMAQDVIQPVAIQWMDRPLEALRAQVVHNDNQMAQHAVRLTRIHKKTHPAINFVLLNLLCKMKIILSAATIADFKGAERLRLYGFFAFLFSASVTA